MIAIDLGMVDSSLATVGPLYFDPLDLIDVAQSEMGRGGVLAVKRVAGNDRCHLPTSLVLDDYSGSQRRTPQSLFAQMHPDPVIA